MTARVEEIRARTEAATEGPWTVTFDGDGYPNDWEESDPPHGWIEPHGAYTGNLADNDFIANARTDIPWLLAVVDQLAEALRELVAIAEQDERDNPPGHRNSVLSVHRNVFTDARSVLSRVGGGQADEPVKESER